MINKWLVSPFLSIALLLMLSLAVAACGPQPAGTTSASSMTNSSTTNNSTPATTAATSSTPSSIQTSSTTPTTSSATTSTKATTTSNSTSSSTSDSPSSSPQKCGTISMSPLQLQGAAPAQQVGGCFWQAYQQCSPASMLVSATGMDTTISHSLLIEKKNGSCAIVDTLSKALAPKPATATTYICSGMTNNNGTLHLTGCGTEGDIIIPIR